MASQAQKKYHLLDGLALTQTTLEQAEKNRIWLIEQALKKGFSIPDIAAAARCSTRSIYRIKEDMHSDT